MTAAEAGSSSEPTRSFEIERKFDADDHTPLPDLSAVSFVSSIGSPERRDLDARYFDTAEFALASAGYAVRRRTGGPDEGWHVKGPRTGGGRVELGWPLGAGGDDAVPEEVRSAVAAVTAAALDPIARIRNTRTAYALRDADGSLVAEFVDDRVSALDERTQVERVWREWEVELGPAAPADPRALFAEVDAVVAAAGARPAASDSKLARALGY